MMQREVRLYSSNNEKLLKVCIIPLNFKAPQNFHLEFLFLEPSLYEVHSNKDIVEAIVFIECVVVFHFSVLLNIVRCLRVKP